MAWCWLVPILQELTDLERRQQLQVALETLKRVIPQYSLAAQTYIKNPSSREAKVGGESSGDSVKQLHVVRSDSSSGLGGKRCSL